MIRRRARLAGLLALLLALAASAISSRADYGEASHRESLAITAVDDHPIATIGLRPGDHHQAVAGAGTPGCDKDIDATGSIAGVAFVAAQDNVICTSADIDVYENGGETYVVQAGGEEAAFLITHVGADGTPTPVTTKTWTQTNTYTPDVKAFKQGARRYIALGLERLALGNAACGVVIVEVTDAPTTPIVDQVIGSDWCDVHNVFVEDDAGGDGRYVYLTADLPNDMRVLDIGDLTGITEIGRYTHPEASSASYVHDVTVVDHGGAAGRRVYVSYWAAGLMILDAADVTPGVVELGSPNQPLNPNHSIDPAGFLTHHAYPSDDGTRVFIQDEFLSGSGDEPVQMWDVSSPGAPSYVDGIILGSALMPVPNPAHNLLVIGQRLYVGWYKAGLQAFDFDPTGFASRALYHQVQTEPSDDAYDGAWGVRLAPAGGNTYIVQSDRRYGLIVSGPDADDDGVADSADNCPAWANADQSLPPWSVPADDPDCDGFDTEAENNVGTEPFDACPDDAIDDAWPPDFNTSRSVNIVDALFYSDRIGSSTGDPDYSPRYDFNASETINIVDVLFLGPFIGLSCTL